MILFTGGGACVPEGGRAWSGACMARGCDMHAPREIVRLRHTVNERAVRILLECMLVYN